jgi:hypothetical protein
MRSSFSGRVTPLAAGARLGLRMEIETRGLLRAALPLLRRRIPRNLERDIAVIKAKLEEQAQPRPPRPEARAGGSEAALRAIKAHSHAGLVLRRGVHGVCPVHRVRQAIGVAQASPWGVVAPRA